MSTYTQILYQIVFSTKYRDPTMIKKDRPLLFESISGVLKEKDCHLYQVNGVEDHLHIVTHLHPSVALADLVKDIKLSAWDLIKRNDMFPSFSGWQDGYGAFTYAVDAKDRLIEYVINQETHHRSELFIDEYKALLKEHKIEFDEKYLL
jgi:putative transposase